MRAFCVESTTGLGCDAITLDQTPPGPPHPGARTSLGGQRLRSENSICPNEMMPRQVDGAMGVRRKPGRRLASPSRTMGFAQRRPMAHLASSARSTGGSVAAAARLVAVAGAAGFVGVYSQASNRSSRSWSRDPLGQADELRCGHRFAGLPVGPRAEDPEEVVVADLEAQGVQRHGAAVVHGDVEQQLRSRDHRSPRSRTGRRPGSRTCRSRRSPGPSQSLALAPQPLGVGGEALVEPDVLPQVEAEVVAEPLVRQLVHDDALGRRSGRVKNTEGVDRPGLVLQCEAEALEVVDDAAGGAERVRTEVPGEEVDDLRLAGERCRGDVAWCRAGRSSCVATIQSLSLPGLPAGGRRRSTRRADRRRPRTRCCPHRSTPRCRRWRRLALEDVVAGVGEGDLDGAAVA